MLLYTWIMTWSPSYFDQNEYNMTFLFCCNEINLVLWWVLSSWTYIMKVQTCDWAPYGSSFQVNHFKTTTLQIWEKCSMTINVWETVSSKMVNQIIALRNVHCPGFSNIHIFLHQAIASHCLLQPCYSSAQVYAI